jgi:DNA modification methylase
MIDVNKLSELLSISSIVNVKLEINKLLDELKNSLTHNDSLSNKDETSFLITELEQILNTRTLERTRYYIKRLTKALTEEKRSNFNDFNLNKWKQYNHIITDSLWIFENRDRTGAHNAKYWGNFIPQIPNQLIQRFTKKGETVLDPFVGSGTTLIEARRLGRNSIGIDISEVAIKLCVENLSKEENINNVFTEVIHKNCLEVNIEDILQNHQLKGLHLVILHPPYWDIIKFSDDDKDLSNSKNLDSYLDSLQQCVSKFADYLERRRYLALVIGDKYSNSEWIPLGFLAMQKVIDIGLKLKSIIVKNFEDTAAKRKQKELWRYRALVGGYYIFKHEYIFLFQKD